MTDIRTTLLVATALLTTHPSQPKGRQIADRLPGPPRPARPRAATPHARTEGVPMTDLRALLGDRYDAVLGNAYTAFRSRLIFNTAPNAIVSDAIERALAAVLPDLLAAAWDEGVEAMTQAVVLAREGRTAEARAAILPNPYRAAHAAAHSAAQGVPASQCGPDAARPADGIVRGTHYGTEGGER